jgi:hypothetical protein
MNQEKANLIENLLVLKYDRDFYMTTKSWEDYIHSIGCSFSPIVVERYEAYDPDVLGQASGVVRKIYIPLEIGLKVLTLGGFP